MTEFNNRMEATRAGFASWMDGESFPLDENLIKGTAAKEDAVFFVDVGGGTAHDLQTSCLKYPYLPGLLILQDQAAVINEATDLDPRIYEMAHNIFEPQPVRGARTYYMRRILHDWPDTKYLEILSYLKATMRKEYSKLLVNEHVIPDRSTNMLGIGLDLIMISPFASRERTEGDWKTLLESAGFKILRIWPVELGLESLIEAEIA